MRSNLFPNRRSGKANQRKFRGLRTEQLEGRLLLATCIEFDTELTSLDLSGGPFPIPLGLGQTFVDSQVSISLSSQRDVDPGPASVGKAVARDDFAEPSVAATGIGCGALSQPINPDELDGKEFFVDSFFDVFFDITVTDVDPDNDYAGLPDGATIFLPDNGPANVQSGGQEKEPVIFDKTLPNFGLIPPPETDPYIGHFNVEIPLNADLNDNGENDKVKFTFVSHSAGDENREFITLPDGTVIDQFDSAAFLAGAVVDESTDPPFTIGELDPDTGLPDPDSFGGPTTATSTLMNPSPLVIDGTDGKDKIEVKLKKDDQVEIKIKSEGSKETKELVPLHSFNQIIINGLAGDDDIKVDKKILLDTLIDGGDGKDKLQGGGGNNILIGGAGDDKTKGGDDRDLLIGGEGKDKLDGKKGDDILVGGFTDQDNDPLALDTIMAEWTSDEPYEDRVLEVSLLLDANADNVKDELTGGQDQDLFFADDADKVKDAKADEIVIVS